MVSTLDPLEFQNLAFFDDPANSIGALTTRLSTEANTVKDATGNLNYQTRSEPARMFYIISVAAGKIV